MYAQLGVEAAESRQVYCIFRTIGDELKADGFHRYGFASVILGSGGDEEAVPF